MVVPSNVVVRVGNGLGAGPERFLAKLLLCAPKTEPWQGQLMVPFEGLLTAHPWWVHVTDAVSNESCPDWANLITITSFPPFALLPNDRLINPPTFWSADSLVSVSVIFCPVREGAVGPLSFLEHPWSVARNIPLPAVVTPKVKTFIELLRENCDRGLLSKESIGHP